MARARLIPLVVPLLLGSAIRLGDDRLPPTLDPLAPPGTPEERLGRLVYDRIYTLDAASGQWRSRVAEELPSADGFALRPVRGQRWHDGRPVTAEDLCFSVRTVTSERAPPWWRGPARDLRGCEVVDGAARMRLAHPDADPRRALAIPLLPAHAFADADPWFDSPLARAPVGSGPYAATPDHGTWLLRARSDAVHHPTLGRLLASPVGDPLAAVQSMIAGDIDGLVSVPPSLVSELAAADGLTLRWFDRRTWWYVALNVHDGPFADPRVREGLDLALSRDALRSELIGVDEGAEVQPAERIGGPFLRRSPFYNRGVPPTPYDPTQSSALLAQAGWTLGPKGLVRDGAPLVVRIGMPTGLELDARATLAAISRQWEVAGVTVIASELSTSGWAKVLDGDGPPLDALVGAWRDPADDPSPLLETGGWANFSHWSDPETDRLIHAMRAGTDADRQSAGWTLHGQVADARPLLYLWQWDAWSAWSDRLAFTPIAPGDCFGEIERWKLAR